MITEIDAGHVIYDDLELMGLERRLKGHLTKGGLEGERPLVGEKIPDEGMIVIIPKRMSADKTYFNDCTIEVNILLKDIEGEANPQLNELLKKAIQTLSDNEVELEVLHGGVEYLLIGAVEPVNLIDKEDVALV